MSVIKFLIQGSPVVQKNDLVRKTVKTKTGEYKHFVGHSSKLEDTRTAIGLDLYAQYKRQGFNEPIDYAIEVWMTFYVKRQHEPDLDNLPAVVLDAMQGVKVKKAPKAFGILTNDKLIRKLVCEKIVEGDENYDGNPRTEIEVQRYA